MTQKGKREADYVQDETTAFLDRKWKRKNVKVSQKVDKGKEILWCTSLIKICKRQTDGYMGIWKTFCHTHKLDKGENSVQEICMNCEGTIKSAVSSRQSVVGSG